ncbi:MAG: insulinase family protein, partial [Deltaproteobacteria bacterium]|nr:insulinase family protein [Deltaproteobacteria bacterium]
GDLAFDMMQQSAIYREYDALESPATRDAELAQAVLDGDDPQQVLAATFTGLRELTPESASDIARTRFAFDHATLVELQPSGKKSGHTVALAAPVHDAGLRRDVPDPSEAQKPLPPAPSPLAAAHTRTLPNGMTVVLLPLTSVPAIDIRLVFATGTADEDPNQRGAAIEAGYGLQFDLRYLNDLLLFAGAGGTQLVDVEPDTTTFEARGVDMHLDLLLAGLRRWVREGYYEDDELADALRTQAKRADDNGTLTDAWRGALYGKDHPYVAAGLVRRAAPNLSGDQVRAFRAAHYTPDNATLVIAGRFDAAIADRWIDFLFSDWKGHAARRVSPEARAASASLAQFHDTAQVGLNIALPANTGSRAARLVAGEMLQEIADDVRHQLGASYGLHASYEEERLAGTYAIAGWVDAARTADAVQLVRDRLAELRALPDAPFIIARRRVVSRLDSLATSAAALASRVERAVAIDVAPLADIETTAAARALTVADVAPLLADLDLSRASVLLSGPEPDVRHAFDVLGRTPTVVPTFHDADTGDEPATAPPATTHHAQRDSVTIADLEPAITEQGAPDPLMITLGIGAVASSAVEQGEMLHYDCCDGYSLFGELGYRFDAKHAVGLHLAYARTTGQYGTPMMLTMTPMSISAIEGDLFFQAVAYDRLWGALSFGVHVDSIDGTTQMLQGTEAALSFGLTGGVDLLTRGIHRFGPYLQVEGTFLSTSGYGSIGFGAAYRR